MTTANKITIFRIILIPIFVIVLISEIEHSKLISVGIYILAHLSDCLDGYIARKYNQITDMGKFLDPLADKLLALAAFLLFIEWGQMSAWIGMLIIGREFAVTGLRVIAQNRGIVISASTSGKIKTTLTNIGICIMLTPFQEYRIFQIIACNDLIVWIILLVTVWSGVDYFVEYIKKVKE